MSWLSLSKSSKAKRRNHGSCSGLANEESDPTALKRAISSPILTSTTNANIAEVEAVRCGSFQEPEPGETLRTSITDHLSVRDDGAKVSTTSGASDFADHLDGARKEMTGSKDEKSRRATVPGGKRNTLSRVRGAIASRWRSSSLPLQHPFVSGKDQFIKIVDDRPRSPVEGRIARCKAEGLNLCKRNIKRLTGRGIVRRRRVSHIPQPLGNEATIEGKKDYVLVSISSITPPTATHEDEHHHNLPFGDLETAFVGAVDKLSFQTHLRTKPEAKLHSEASTPIMDETKSKGKTPERPPSHLPGLHYERATLIDVRTGLRIPTPEPGAFPKSRADIPYLSSTNVTQRDRRDQVEHPHRVNPLGSHQGVMDFTERRVDTGDENISPAGMSTPRVNITREASGLQNAPIYSPSSDDLTQYGRMTPSPGRTTASFHTAPLLSPGNLHERTRNWTPNETPTRARAGNATRQSIDPPSNKRRLLGRRRSPQLPGPLEGYKDLADFFAAGYKGENIGGRDPKSGGEPQMKTSKSKFFALFGKKTKTRGGEEDRVGSWLDEPEKAGRQPPEEEGEGVMEKVEKPTTTRRRSSPDTDKIKETLDESNLDLSPVRVHGSNRIVAWVPPERR